MVMVTGIWDAAVAGTTTVGAEAADIIMDGGGADIADGISRKHTLRPPHDGAALSTIITSSSMSETILVKHHGSHGVRSPRHVRLPSGRQVFYRRLRRI